MRPFFNRAWKRGTTSGKSSSAQLDPFTSGSFGRGQTKHRRVGSATELALEDLNGDAASQESQQGIVRTVEVSMDWKAHPRGEAGNNKDAVVPRAIADSER
jgi:hypothetical protein